MDRIRTGVLRGADVLLGVEVRPDRDRLVGRARMQGPRVVRRDDRDRPEPELSRGAEHTQCDLTAVRDEHLLHARDVSRRRSTSDAMQIRDSER